MNDFTFDLNDTNFKMVIKKLNSKNPAERYLAVIDAERLTELNKYELTEIDKGFIKKAYESNDLISVCSGCTYFNRIVLNKLLSKEKENFMLTYAEFWLAEYIK